MAIDIGTVVDGTYQIEAMIGRGGMGAVFLASHLRLPGKQVAIKVLHADLAHAEILARFRREAHISSELNHPNIVTVHDTNSLPDGTPYLVMELLEGQNLAQRIADGPMTVEDTIRIARQLAAALAAAHDAGIVHRDLKPQNIFLVPTEVGGTRVEHVKVLDFGISKMRASQTVKTQDSAMLGTPQYMAPEQATGKHAEVDQRTDVFAFGAILYEMLCGQPAFVGASVPEVVFKVVYEEPVPLRDRVPGLEPAIAAVVHRALAKAPDQRFHSVGELIEALTGQPMSVIRPPRRSAALAETVSSGDHGASRLAIAETAASGDHGPTAAATAPPPVTPETAPAPVPAAAPAPAPAPSYRRIAIVAGGIAAIVAGGLVAIMMARDPRGGGRRRPPVVATPSTTHADAAPAPPVDAAVVADAAPAPRPVDARPSRPPRPPRADAAPAPAPANEETDRIYRNGLKALEQNPQRTIELGHRLSDKYKDPRGWVLIGAGACKQGSLNALQQARKRLASNRTLLVELNARCDR